jgi:hypothetical protein
MFDWLIAPEALNVRLRKVARPAVTLHEPYLEQNRSTSP